MDWDGFNEQCVSISLLPASMLPLPLLSTPALNSALQCIAISHNNPVGFNTGPDWLTVDTWGVDNILYQYTVVLGCFIFYPTSSISLSWWCVFLPLLSHSIHLCVKSLFGHCSSRERETMGRSGVFILAYRGTIPRQNITIQYHLY